MSLSLYYMCVCGLQTCAKHKQPLCHLFVSCCALPEQSHFDERDTKLPTDYKMHASSCLFFPGRRLVCNMTKEQKYIINPRHFLQLKIHGYMLIFFCFAPCVTKLLNSYTLQWFGTVVGIILSRGWKRFKIQLQQTVPDAWHPRACTRHSHVNVRRPLHINHKTIIAVLLR